jgi:hypothetical protein
MRIAIAAVESRAAVVVECIASIILITVQLEKALGDEMAASITLVQARAATTETVQAF